MAWYLTGLCYLPAFVFDDNRRTRDYFIIMIQATSECVPVNSESGPLPSTLGVEGHVYATEWIGAIVAAMLSVTLSLSSPMYSISHLSVVLGAYMPTLTPKNERLLLLGKSQLYFYVIFLNNSTWYV